MNLTLITPPTALPINLEDVKTFCRVEDSDNDEILIRFMRSGVELAENYTERRFISQVWRMDIDKFEDNIYLPYPNLISVDSIQYYDNLNVLQTLDSSFYDVSGVGGAGRVSLALGSSYPSTYSRPEAVQITFTCGYGDASAVPYSLRDAISTMVWFLFDGRGNQLDKPFLNYLLGPHIMRGFYESE